MTNTQVEVDVKKLQVDQSRGLRRSNRTQGRKVSYNYEIILSACDEISPEKKRARKKPSKKLNTPPSVDASVVSKEMIPSRIEEPVNEFDWLKFQLAEAKNAYLKVKLTLRLYNSYFLYFIHISDGESKTPTRADLKAMRAMMDIGKILYPKKQLGSIPGVDVGHEFFSRCEMVAVGFHSHWFNGIDYMGKDYCEGDLKEYEFPLAVAIVMSGQYEDDRDNSEEIIYTGQGGNDAVGNKRQIRHQKMEAGNLALKNSMQQAKPVRLIRGHRSKSSSVGKVYTYDGLYKVVEYWAEKGISGYTVYKFRMRRLEGQPKLTTSQVKFIRGEVPDTNSRLPGQIWDDISEGQEKFPIRVTNEIDDPPVPPPVFKYCTSVQVSDNLKIPARTGGCNCKGGCDPKTCACAKLNGSDYPYVYFRNGGRLKEPRAVVFECGPNCGCKSNCISRTSQMRIKYHFEVFRTLEKGWGVRSRDYIPAGALICEYTGTLKRSDDAEQTLDDTYLFDIDCLQTMKGLDGRETRAKHMSNFAKGLLEKEKALDNGPEYCIDAASTGNFSRFINHSCEPNLFIQCVLSCNLDLKLARLVLFAADSIPPLQELTYDYGYALDSVIGPDGKVKQMACYCGADSCRKRLV